MITTLLSFANSEFTFANNLRLNTSSGLSIENYGDKKRDQSDNHQEPGVSVPCFPVYLVPFSWVEKF